jgi:hypothetical protein
LVIRFETGIEFFELLLVDIVCLEGFGGRWLRRREEVEERFSGNFLLDGSGLASCC